MPDIMMEGLHIQVRHISHIQVGHHDMLCHGRVRTRTPTGTSLTRMYSVHTVTGTCHFMNLNQKYSGSESAWQASTTGMPVPRCRGGPGTVTYCKTSS